MSSERRHFENYLIHINNKQYIIIIDNVYHIANYFSSDNLHISYKDRVPLLDVMIDALNMYVHNNKFSDLNIKEYVYKLFSIELMDRHV